MRFYKETNFKDTEIGRIPKEWEVVKLEEIAKKIKDIDHKMPKKQKSGIPFVSIKCMLKYPDLNFYLDFNDPDLEFISKEDYEYHVQRFNVERGDIIYSRFGSIGDAKLITTEQPFIASYSIVLIKPDVHKVNSIFLTCILNSEAVKNQAKIITKGATNRNLHLEDIKNLKVPLPRHPEQQKIAEILSTIDKAIQKTNEIIAKTERLKKGLMKELLTKGIGHKEFKDTEIGRIPKDWEVVKLGDDKIAEIRGNKIISDVQKVAFIPMELVPDHGIFVKYEIRDLKDVSSSTYCEAGDLLLAKITPSLENGKQGIVPDDIPNGFALATTEVYPIFCKGIDRLFLFYVLKFRRFRKILEFSMRGTTGRQRVPKDAVERLKIPLPPYQEQKRIAEILTTIDKKLEIEKKEKEKLERIKQGMMDLLLTGKIRVKVA